MQFFKLTKYAFNNTFLIKEIIEYYLNLRDAQIANINCHIDNIIEEIDRNIIYGLNSVGKFSIDLLIENKIKFKLIEKDVKYKYNQNQFDNLIPCNCWYKLKGLDTFKQLFFCIIEDDWNDWNKANILLFATLGTYQNKKLSFMNEEFKENVQY